MQVTANGNEVYSRLDASGANRAEEDLYPSEDATKEFGEKGGRVRTWVRASFALVFALIAPQISPPNPLLVSSLVLRLLVCFVFSDFALRFSPNLFPPHTQGPIIVAKGNAWWGGATPGKLKALHEAIAALLK